MQRGICGNRFCYHVTVVKIDLVERKHRRHAARLEICDNVALDLRYLLTRVGNEQHAVAVLHGIPRASHHCIAEPVLRAVDAGRVKEHILSSPTVWMPTILPRVVCGLLDTMATFSPRMRFMSVDLPTLGLPTIEINAVLFMYTRPFSFVDGESEYFHYVALAAAHIELVRLSAFVIVAHKMQRRMYAEERRLTLEGMPVKLCLRTCAFK